MRKTVALALLILFAACAFAQYNEREIISQQAYQQLAMRNYAEAEKLFKQVLEKYPDDSNSVLQLLNIYFQTSQLDKAAAILNQSRRVLPQNTAQEQEILLLVMQGRPDDAWDLGQSYLQRLNHGENAYRVLASYFERRGFYDQVLRLYKDARQRQGKPELFTLEIANAALNYRLFKEALTEYLNFLEKNPANLFFIKNQCGIIINEDPSMLAEIGKYLQSSGSGVIRELYANLLVGQNQFQPALEIYKNLPGDKLVRFADEQYAALNDEVAQPAYEHLARTATDPFTRNEYRLRLANVRFRNRDYLPAREILNQITADSLLQTRQNRLRKGINLQARKLLAETALALDGDLEAALRWYEDARKYSASGYDSQDIDLAVVRLQLIREDYPAARRLLASVTDPTLAETRDYLRFSTELMQGNVAAADSLMNEYVIKYPAGIYVNDAFYQTMLVLGLQGGDRERFFAANRLMLLRDTAAVDSLASLYEGSQDEELLILAVEWSILLSDETRALNLLQREWTDEVCAEYAALLKLMLTSDSEAEQRMAREFLKENPNSIFAPKFRQRLSRANYSRPEY